MKKVSEIYGSAKGPVYSFEFFPPKTPEGDSKLMETVKELSLLNPDFVRLHMELEALQETKPYRFCLKFLRIILSLRFLILPV